MINKDDIRDLDEGGVMWEYYNTTTSQRTVADMVREFSHKLLQVPDPSLYSKLICEEYEEWVNENPRTEGDLKELADLVYVIYGYANAVGYNLDEAIRRVHANNLGRCLQPDGTIKRREDGKVIKNPDYPKVTLADLI
jgi:predicted house-cleaning noncanonical NTP pyrophosphatase (MazG superfamily)